MRMSGAERNDDSDVAFASIDFSGVDFDESRPHDAPDEKALALAVQLEEQVTFGHLCQEGLSSEDDEELYPFILRELYELLSAGRYVEALSSESAKKFFGSIVEQRSSSSSEEETSSVALQMRRRVLQVATTSVLAAVEVELLAIAALNLFLQLNYTGPSLELNGTIANTNSTESWDDPLADINPHASFRPRLCAASKREETTGDGEENRKREGITAPKRDSAYHNAVLAELAVEGEWPCQVCHVPYMLLVARSMLSALANPRGSNWTRAVVNDAENVTPSQIKPLWNSLKAVPLWNARATVAHERLLQSKEPSPTLWKETKDMFQDAISTFCDNVDTNSDDSTNGRDRLRAALVVLEWGLAQHHFNRPGSGKASFRKAMQYSGVQVEVTGVMGKRTKHQQDSKPQMVVHAASKLLPGELNDRDDTERQEKIKSQMVQHSEDGILLERIIFEDDKENVVTTLSTLDQAILLSLCLDVKNNNPADGLTAEQMGAYLARVLDHHDDWMIYSTALLERAWLECERTHGRERAILQIQALTDQHTNRLTITQSTFASVEESAPAQERLRNLHSIVYPPRWVMLRDLAERYAKIGVVTSAAELFEEIELWDEVVECYRHAGKASKAEHVVRERLAEAENPRMWAALGDLTNDPSCYEKAIQLSNGRFSSAYVALGKHHFEMGDLVLASDCYSKALEIRPLSPHVWFRLGTISMQLEDWEMALNSFSEVVQQEPEEAEAWANVAAVHMRNKRPAEAYSALVESLKYQRNNWRVWISKLYTCLDLKKYDEAIQASFVLLDFKDSKSSSEGIPDLEEKCVRAIVGGSIASYKQANGDQVAMDSARRTLSRVHELLERLVSSGEAEPWIFETRAYFNAQIGRDKEVYGNLMNEYRALQSIQGWEKDQTQINKVIQVVSCIASLHEADGSRERLSKCKLLVSGVLKKIRAAHLDESQLPERIHKLEEILKEVDNMLKAKA